jgi:hypothetical protein
MALLHKSCRTNYNSSHGDLTEEIPGRPHPLLAPRRILLTNRSPLHCCLPLDLQNRAKQRRRSTTPTEIESMGEPAHEATSTDSRLQQLRRQYFALYPIRLIDFATESNHGGYSLHKHQDWIYQHILDTPYQPASDYQRKFLKALISVIEEDLQSAESIAEEWVCTAAFLHPTH